MPDPKATGVQYLSTKIRPPRPARGVISRPRLDVYLDLVRTRLLTVVKSPAGFGKTSVALAWAEVLAGDGARVAWLSLGPEDNEDERFLRYVAAALRRAFGEASGAPDWMVSELSIPIDRRVAWLIEEMAAQPEEVFLFLDDVQEITRPSIGEGLSLLLRRAPENVHLVLLGRDEPALDLAWLRMHDAVFELDAAALRFDLTETQQLLRKAELGPEIVDQAALLHTLTSGWIAALRTAMLTLRTLSLQKSPRPARYLQRLPATLRTINQLFADLLDQLAPELIDFMERISVCERFCATLAERLTGMSNGQAMLVRLEKQQLFVSSQDDEERWFSFHRLFRDFLQRRARERAGAELPAVHRAAAQWFAEERLWSEAIQHALAAGETNLALRWIEQHAMTIVGAGDLLTLLSWERQLQSHLVQSPPRLRLAFAWGLGLAMDCDKALALLDGVEAELDAGTFGDDEELRRECKALRSVLVMMTGDYALGERLAEECIAAPTEPPWVTNAIRNVIAGARLHAGQWERLYAAPPLLGERQDLPGDRMSLAYRLSIRGLAEYRQGHLEEAALLLERAMDVGASAGLRSAALIALPAPTLALVRYEQDRIDDAARINAEHMDVNRRIGPIQGLIGAYLIAARLARLQGQASRARALLDEAEAIGAARGWRRVEVAMLLEKTRYCLIDSRGTEAVACVGRIEALATAAAGTPELERLDFNDCAALARAWIDLAEDRHARATQALESELAFATASGRLLDEIAIATSLALAKFGVGERDEAIRIFLKACAQAQRIGALRSIVDQPVELGPLIAAVRAKGDLTELHAWLNGHLESLERARRKPSRQRKGASAVESLSPRERNILKLIAEGRTNKEIARGLGITSETVKTHVKKIFSKLGVQSRAQAAALAGDG